MSFLLGVVRRLATLPLVRRLTSVTPLLRLSYSLRATLVRERARFVRNELRGPVTATYHLRESGIAIAIRRRTGDVLVLDEIFSQREVQAPIRRATGAVGRAVDLGANIGLFGAWLLGRCPDVEILAYEADPANTASSPPWRSRRTGSRTDGTSSRPSQAPGGGNLASRRGSTPSPTRGGDRGPRRGHAA